MGEEDSGELFTQFFQNVFDGRGSSSNNSRTGSHSATVGTAEAVSSSDNETKEEREEDFLIQQTAQRLSRANQSSRGNGSIELLFEGSVSSQDASTIMKKPWHDERHEEQRRLMETEIATLLRNRKPSPQSEEWSNQLPYKARKLSDRLYRSASSLEAYLDLSTLKERLQRVAQEIFKEYNQKRSINGRSSARASARLFSGNDPTSSLSSRDSLRSLQESFNNNASLTPRRSVDAPNISLSMPPPASVAQNNSNNTNAQVRGSTERSAKLKEQQESIERLEAKIRDEIRQQEELEQRQNATDQLLLQQRIREESMRLQLQQQQQQQQQFASQSHLQLSLQSLSDGMNQQLRPTSLTSGALSDLLQSRNLHSPVGNLSSFLVQPTGAAAAAQYHLRTQQLLLQHQQQQQQQQFQQQQQRLSLSGLESFAERQRLQNELLMMSMTNSGPTASSLLQQQQALLLQQRQQQQQQQLSINSNGPNSSNSHQQQVEDDAPLSPGALDRFWDER